VKFSEIDTERKVIKIGQKSYLGKISFDTEIPFCEVADVFPVHRDTMTSELFIVLRSGRKQSMVVLNHLVYIWQNI
jgi:hypothetical protein